MERNVPIMFAGRLVAALALLVLAGCAPTTAGGAAPGPATVEPVGTPVPVPSVQPVGTAVPAPSLAPTATLTSTVMPTSELPTEAPLQSGVIVGASVPSTITLGATVPATATTTSPLPGPGGATGQLTVTQADQGKTVPLHVGDRFLLALGEGYDWTVNIDNQNVVSRVIGILTVRGSQGIFEAHQAGTATLTAMGDPVCRQSQPPCGQPSILFTVKLGVQ
jgi:hypothetical protein